jgi:homocitrate synthase NifV
MSRPSRIVAIRDVTLREGLDTPGVSLSSEQRLRIARALAAAGVSEIEVAAPASLLEDLALARTIREAGLPLATSGLVYANRSGWQGECEEAMRSLDRFDLLMPLSNLREPRGFEAKLGRLEQALSFCAERGARVGAGFPHSTQVPADAVAEIGAVAARAGASRITAYDTNGSADPFAARDLVLRVKRDVGLPLFFHGHNDLGLATANALAAVGAGADGLDVTVNGLGDRAGNASLEQAVVGLYLRGFSVPVAPGALLGLSRLVEEESGVPVSWLAPVAGRFVFQHKSPSHLEHPELFEAYDPALLGAARERMER